MTQSSKKSKWGLGIFVLYGGFVIFMLSMIIYVSNQNIQLVAKDYYQQDLVYQNQIDRMERTNMLAKKLTIKMSDDAENMTINFPVEINKEISGTIKFFRPSNARLDFEVAIASDTLGLQIVETTQLTSGFWKVQISWMVDSVEYYYQEPLMIN